MTLKYLFFFHLCVLSLFGNEFTDKNSLIARDEPLCLSTSIIVPCHQIHFKFLKSLLDDFCHQTTLPDEVVISLSESYKIDKGEIDKLHQIEWPFSLQLISTDEKKKAGENRNIACEHAHGELLLLIDADDIMHPYRVEITKYFFEKYQVDFMLHKFVRKDEDFLRDNRAFRDFEKFNPFYFDLEYYFDQYRYYVLHNGHPSFLRSVFKEVQYTSCQRGQDVLFNQAVLKKFKYVVWLPANLSLYLSQYSTWNNKKKGVKDFEKRIR